jgi:bleomycin hydrolase
MKRKLFSILIAAVISISSFSQTAPVLTPVKSNEHTAVKNQNSTGTCWCFSTTSLVESMSLKKGAKDVDISEMFIVRNIYVEKARNYVLRQGTAQFGEGGLGHDLIRGIATYGAVPESIYSGKKEGQQTHNHSKMVTQLKSYLDSILKKMPIADNWMDGYTAILDNALGKVPASFEYNGSTYTPQSYAKDVLKFDANDYVSITSFTHHPFYQQFILEAPDNFANGSFYNVPLEELSSITRDALLKNYTVMWDADVSNRNFAQGKGFAMYWKDAKAPVTINPDEEEKEFDATTRQQLYENLTTQDDHLMHIVGLNKSTNGKEFFLVKNSWGEVGPYKGFINVSPAYFAINTVGIVVPRAALSKSMKKKLGIK